MQPCVSNLVYIICTSYVSVMSSRAVLCRMQYSNALDVSTRACVAMQSNGHMWPPAHRHHVMDALPT